MSWRWLIFDYADPSLPLSFVQRLRMSVRMLAIWKLPKQARIGRLLFGAGAGVIGGLIFIVHYQYFHFPSWELWMLVPPHWVSGTLLYGLFCRKEHFIRIRLEGFNCCTNCGYWLRGLEGDTVTCPECGSTQANEPSARDSE